MRDLSAIPGMRTHVIAEWNRRALNDGPTRALTDTAWNTGLRVPLLNHEVLRMGAGMHVFSHTIEPRMKASDQLMTGRCWAFAGLNLLRRALAKRFSLPEDFELSQTFVLFHDKLEKAYAFLTHVLQTRHLPSDDRIVNYLFKNVVQDGGTWNGFVSLVCKYGIVPAASMRESTPATQTRTLNKMLRMLLMQSAHRLRNPSSARFSCEREIADVMRRVHRLLCVCMGTPPSDVEWTFEEKENKVVRTYRRTPLALYANTGVRLEDYVTLVHVPSKDKEFGRSYHVEYLDAVVESPHPNRFHNVESLEGPTRAALEAGDGVWFACEFDELRLREDGLLHHDLVNHARAIGEAQECDKETRVDSRNVDVNHAMLFTGFHQDGPRVLRWQVENSHGTDDADGYLAMTDEWFRRHVFVVAVPRRFAPRLSDAPPTVLPPWDVLGAVM